jgi:hypothetical protein
MRLGLRTLLLGIFVHPSEDFHTPTALAVMEERGGVLLAQFDDSVVWDRGVTEAVHLLTEPYS